MPVFRAGPGQAPAWCEMRQFDIVRLPAGGARYDFGRAGPREKLIVGEGACTIAAAGREQAAAAGANIDLPAGEGGFSILDVSEDATLIRMAGNWGRRGRRLRAVLGGGGRRRRARGSGRPRPLRETDPLRLPLPRLRRVLDPLRGQGRRGHGGGSATKSPQATAWPPAWATTTTSRSCMNRCAPSTSRPPWRGRGGGGTCGTTRTGRRSRGGSGCDGGSSGPHQLRILLPPQHLTHPHRLDVPHPREAASGGRRPRRPRGRSASATGGCRG